MKKITAFAATTALTASLATGAFAAGPTVVEEEPEPVVLPDEEPAGTGLGAGAIAAGVAGLAALALIASDDDDDDDDAGTTTTTPTN